MFCELHISALPSGVPLFGKKMKVWQSSEYFGAGLLMVTAAPCGTDQVAAVTAAKALTKQMQVFFSFTNDKQQPPWIVFQSINSDCVQTQRSFVFSISFYQLFHNLSTLFQVLFSWSQIIVIGCEMIYHQLKFSMKSVSVLEHTQEHGVLCLLTLCLNYRYIHSVIIFRSYKHYRHIHVYIKKKQQTNKVLSIGGAFHRHI